MSVLDRALHRFQVIIIAIDARRGRELRFLDVGGRVAAAGAGGAEFVGFGAGEGAGAGMAAGAAVFGGSGVAVSCG